MTNAHSQADPFARFQWSPSLIWIWDPFHWKHFAFQIRWKICFVVLQLLAIATKFCTWHSSPQLSCQVQHFVVIILLQRKHSKTNFSLKVNCNGKNASEMVLEVNPIRYNDGLRLHHDFDAFLFMINSPDQNKKTSVNQVHVWAHTAP